MIILMKLSPCFFKENNPKLIIFGFEEVGIAFLVDRNIIIEDDLNVSSTPDKIDGINAFWACICRNKEF
jgi:hypothetical protein